MSSAAASTDNARIEPDGSFIRKVLSQGGASVQTCYQCATCSVVCQLSPDEKPFPRKEMIWTQWGLADRILGGPDIWLCHQCNDCSVNCPRGAKPAEVLSSLRSVAIEHYSVPRFMSRMVLRAAYLPLLIIIPAVILGVAVALFGDMRPEGGEVIYSRMFPHAPLNTLFTALSVLAFIGVFAGAVKYWKAMNAQRARNGLDKPVAFSLGGFARACLEILGHSRFRKCPSEKTRFISHILVLAGFAGLLVVTAAAIFYIVFFHLYPLPVHNPFKMLGNLSALMLLVGLTMMIVKRLMGRREQVGKGSYYDWFFLVVLFSVVVTGIVCEVLRLGNASAAAYPMYFVHMMFIFALLIYAPYSKFAHVVYRTVAMTYERNGKQGCEKAAIDVNESRNGPDIEADADRDGNRSLRAS